MALPAEFEAWWKTAKDLSEFRGVTEAAALALWQVAGGKMPIKKEEEADPLPEDFVKFWTNATNLAEFRGCTMAAAYAAWLDGQKHPVGIPEKIRRTKVNVIAGSEA